MALECIIPPLQLPESANLNEEVRLLAESQSTAAKKLEHAGKGHSAKDALNNAFLSFTYVLKTALNCTCAICFNIFGHE